MKRATLALLLALAASCSTTTAPPPAADLLPPPDWWHDPRLTDALKLTDAQLDALDRVHAAHAAELERLRADAASATRDLRAVLNADHPPEPDLAAAGQRLRTARDAAFGEELQLLAAERAVLSHTQWEALEDLLRAAASRYPRYGSYPRGGGRRPGGVGRWP